MLKLAAALIAGLVAMGGWAVVTVKDLPEYFVAGRQYTLEFQVRQHGRTLLSNLQPRLVVSTSARRLGGIVGGKDETTIPAVAKSAAGTYAVTFTAPAAERVFLTIQSGFGNNKLRLYPQPVMTVGPELGGRDLAREYVIQKMKNPASQIMPDLGLTDAEAAAIAAFLSGAGAGAGAATTGR